MNYEEITKSEKTLSEMKQKIRKLKKTLRDPNAICELYDINKVREELRKKHEPVKVVASNESIEAGFAEMQKLDEVLKKKSEEEKAARLSRMQEEEESRDILTDLLTEEVSECIRNNSEQFLRLVNGWEQMSSGGGSLESLPNSTDGQAAPAPVKRERPIKRRRRPGTFIERNIQLAKCGNGVLSLTDEEKIRIENLLKEPDTKTANDTIVSDDSSLSNGVVDLNSSFSSSVCSENLYVLSDEAKELLEQIDQKLKEFAKLKVPETIPKFKSAAAGESNTDTKETESSKDEQEQEIEKCVKKKENKKRMVKNKFFPLKDEAYRLKEVDKLLGLINSVSNDEISPLSEEDIHLLVEKVKLSLDVLPPGDTTDRTEVTESTTTENESHAETQSSVISMPMPSPETMLELVDAAKSQMANFKYRYTC